MTTTVLPWPAQPWADPYRIEWGLTGGALVNRSQLTNAIQTATDPFARWLVTLAMNKRPNDEQAARSAFLNSLQGQAKRVALWNHDRPRPAGTLRGIPSLAQIAQQFAESIYINGTNGATLKAGDYLGVGPMLVQVTDDVTISGATEVPITPRIRTALNPGILVKWDRPTAQFVLTTPSALVPFEPVNSPSFAVSFEETWL